MKEIKATGYFWIREKPEEKFEGTLYFDAEDGCKLETIAARFYDERLTIGSTKMRTSNPIEFEIIYGNVNGLGEVTLYKCHSFGFSMSTGDIIYSEFILLGHHFDVDEIRFDSIQFGLTYLSDWFVGKSGITGREIHQREHHKFEELELKFSLLDTLTYDFNNFGLTFYLGGSWQWGLRQFQIKETATAEIIPDKPTTLIECINTYIWQLKNFIDFATDRNNSIENLKGILILDNEQKSIEILFQERTLLSEKKKNYIAYIHDIIFGFIDIEETFQQQYQLLIDKQEKLASVIQLYLTTIHETIYLNMNLLLLTQALETYHRQMYGGQYMPDIDYRAVYDLLMKSLPSTVSHDFRQKMRDGTFKYANQYSLGKRLKLILNDVLQPISSFIDKLIPNKADFIQKVVKTRNYLTHHEIDDETQLIKSSEYSRYVNKLNIILLACILIELEIPSNELTTILQRSHRISRWA